MEHGANLMLTWVGILSLIIFVVAYIAIAMEEKLHINKSKPALFAGTVIFLLAGIYHFTHGQVPESLHSTVEHLVITSYSIHYTKLYEHRRRFVRIRPLADPQKATLKPLFYLF